MPTTNRADRDWFGADIIRRLDHAIDEWARERRPPGSPRSRPRDLDEKLGYNREWWPGIRSGKRRATSGLTLGQIQSMCEVMGLEPETIVGRPTPLGALRGLAGRSNPKTKRLESLLDGSLRLRREGDLPGAAGLLVRAAREQPDLAEVWIRASYLLGFAARIADAISAAREGLVVAVLGNDQRGEARSLMALGTAYFHQDGFSEAESCYQAALRQKDALTEVDLWALYQNRGRNLTRLGRVEEATSALHRSLEYATTTERRCFIWWLIGDIKRESGQPIAALEAYEQALELGTEARAEVTPVDRAHLLTLTATMAYESGREETARALMPAALVLLSELSRVAPEARAILSGAHTAAAHGERAAAWKVAAESLARIRKQMEKRPIPDRE